ncbi:MAG: DUF3467 domain-containing protein [Planctomycetes bacterium]|nr:DUF3467 domain-containing protein [Planctomycetota bacterium]
MAGRKNDRQDDAAVVDGQAGGVRTTLQIDDTNLEGHYANLTRVIAGPEEVVVDFGLAIPSQQNPQHQVARFTDRVVLNYYNAKRLAMALQATVIRYEKAYGAVELDVRKRQLPPADDGQAH